MTNFLQARLRFYGKFSAFLHDKLRFPAQAKNFETYGAALWLDEVIDAVWMLSGGKKLKALCNALIAVKKKKKKKTMMMCWPCG